jgi:hypothetical protein
MTLRWLFVAFCAEGFPQQKSVVIICPVAAQKTGLFELHIGNLLSVRHLKVVNDHNASFCLLAICAHFFSLAQRQSRSSNIASRGE